MSARILVAEDDSALNSLVVSWLRRAHLEVDSVTDGEAAVRQIQNVEYSAILLDVMMPQLTGLDVIEYVKEHQPKLLQRIIVMTAGGESVTDKVRSSAVYKLVEKPFDLRELLDHAMACITTKSGAQVTFSRHTPETASAPRALIVDDDEASRYLMERPLKHDFVIDVAATGAEAIEQLKTTDYDLVLLDLKMPGIDGLGVLRYVEAHQRYILDRVVLVTVTPEAVAGTRVGGVIPKPIDGDELASYVKTHLLRTR